MDEDQQRRKDKVSRLIDTLSMTNLYAKQSMAFMLIGMKMIHYGVARLSAFLADRTETVQEREAAVEEAMTRMRNLSMKGFKSETLITNISELDKILREDLEKEKEKDRQSRERELQLGIPTPFDTINRMLKGGMKAGKVVMVHGESNPVFTTLAGMYRHFVHQKVPITHFCVGKQEAMPDVPGVKNIPGAFWRGQGSSLKKMKDVFKEGEGYVFVVDNLDWLIDHDETHKSEAKKRQVALKYLVKIARRFKVGIVVGLVTCSDSLPSANDTYRLPVCSRVVDGKAVYMAGDEMFMEESNGRLCILGGKDPVETGLGGSDGGPEGPEQLERSCED